MGSAEEGTAYDIRRATFHPSTAIRGDSCVPCIPLLFSLCVLALPVAPIQSQTSGSSGTAAGLQSSDLSRLRAVNDVEFSPDGKTIAYTVIMRDHPGRAYSQLWVMDVATRKSSRLER